MVCVKGCHVRGTPATHPVKLVKSQLSKRCMIGRVMMAGQMVPVCRCRAAYRFCLPVPRMALLLPLLWLLSHPPIVELMQRSRRENINRFASVRFCSLFLESVAYSDVVTFHAGSPLLLPIYSISHDFLIAECLAKPLLFAETVYLGHDATG